MFLAVVLTSVVMFMVGAAWYMGLFAKPWGEMFGFDKLSKAEQAKQRKEMGPWMGLQVVVTVLMAWGLATLIRATPDLSPYLVAFWLWLGIVVPTQVSAVIFGGVDAKWIPRRIAIMTGEALVRLLVAAWVLSMFSL